MFAAIQNRQRAEQLARIASHGLSASDERWLRAIIRLSVRGWCRNGAYAVRQLSVKRWEWRVCDHCGSDIGLQGAVSATTKADVYLDLASAIESAARS